jgi:hypothetical protein
MQRYISISNQAAFHGQSRNRSGLPESMHLRQVTIRHGNRKVTDGSHLQPSWPLVLCPFQLDALYKSSALPWIWQALHSWRSFRQQFF